MSKEPREDHPVSFGLENKSKKGNENWEKSINHKLRRK
jgi:hypothetical protein